MEYTDYAVEDFVRDEYFQKWIIAPDDITLDFWQKWVDDHPEKRELVQCAINLILLICNETTFQLELFDVDALWQKILLKRDEIEIDIPKSEFKSIKYKAKDGSKLPKKNKKKSDSNKDGIA